MYEKRGDSTHPAQPKTVQGVLPISPMPFVLLIVTDVSPKYISLASIADLDLRHLLPSPLLDVIQARLRLNQC